MFGLFLRSRRSSRPTLTSRRLRPQLEILEWRDCPSAPVAVNDLYNIVYNNAITASSPGVLGNDLGTSTLTATKFSNPSSGSLTFNNDGSFVYTPNATFTGTDSFTYEAYDGTNYSSPATVSLQVNLAAQPRGTINGNEGSLTEAGIATIQSTNSSAKAGDFTATINWGDNSSTSYGTITQTSAGNFAVNGSHTYALPGNYTVLTNLSDSSGNYLTTQTPAMIANVAPTLTMSLAYNSQRSVTLSGRVTDGSPGGLTVSFIGEVTGTTTTNADGTYSYTANAAGLGTISATVTNSSGLTSTAVTCTVQANAPTISNFQAVRQSGNIWTFSGTVTDQSAQNLTVHFGGLDFMTTQTATVRADGTFSLTVELPAESDGWVTAQVTDWWGLASNVPDQWVNPS
jgi:hypothetical protein